MPNKPTDRSDHFLHTRTSTSSDIKTPLYSSSLELDLSSNPLYAVLFHTSSQSIHSLLSYIHISKPVNSHTLHNSLYTAPIPYAPIDIPTRYSKLPVQKTAQNPHKPPIIEPIGYAIAWMTYLLYLSTCLIRRHVKPRKTMGKAHICVMSYHITP